MAQITLNVPDAVLDRVLDAVGVTFGYEQNGAGRTKAQFAKAVLADWLTDIVVNHEASKEADGVWQSTADRVRSGVTIG
jgi:hypothetical protein